MKRSRRQMLKLLAAGSAATLAAPGAALAARRRATRPGAAPQAAHAKAQASDAIRAEVERQKKDLAKQLATIRGHALPPGSEMAFVFRPLRPVRADGGR